MQPRVPRRELADWLRGLTKQELAQFNSKVFQEVRREYEEFKAAFGKRKCYLCEKDIAWFGVNRPCIHWLLKPTGFKKRHFPLIFETHDYRQMSSYARWVASLEGPGKNVNDLVEEHSGTKLIDFTARFQHFTWSFSCGESDFKGHVGSESGGFPHYHLQMTVNGRPFIDYSDFHVPFSAADLDHLELARENPDLIILHNGPGLGMQDLVQDEEALNIAIKTGIPAENPAQATFEVHTLITAREGKTVSGSEVAEVIEEAKRRGSTMASVAQERFKDAHVRFILSPGPGIVDVKPRAPRRKKPRPDG